MLIFIDDSGDPGFKLDKGSTRYFLIAMVIFEDELEAEKTSVAIKELKRELKFPDDLEFKFYKSSKDVRKKFLLAVKKFNFYYRCLVIDKTVIRSNELKNNKSSFYSYAIKTVLKYSNYTSNAKVKIDGSGDRVFRRNFLAYLKKQLNSGDKKVIKNCKLVDSKGNQLIQLADMVAGSVRRSFEDNDYVYRDLIKNKENNVWNFK